MNSSEQTVDDVLDDGRKVMVFYSSQEHPQLLDEYEETLNDLTDIGVETSIIDIAEDPETARSHGIRTAPVVLVVDEGVKTKYRGVVDGLREVLDDSLLGKSSLFDTCFEKGREAAIEHEIAEDTTGEKAESVLSTLLPDQAASVTVEDIDTDAQEVRISIVPADEQSDDSVIGHDQFAAVFKGFFTEMFDTTVVEEVRCAREGAERCVFEVEGSTEQ